MSRQRGFTLIELLVVIAILSLLVVSFMPDLWGAHKAAEATQTEALLLTLQTGVKAYESNVGLYPPDTLVDPRNKLQLKLDNGINTSSEALLVFLASSRGIDVDALRDNLDNTDKDEQGGVVPNLNGTARQEIVDAWGTPIAWFSISGGGFGKVQRIQLREDQGGTVIDAKAWTQDGAPLGSGKYQLVSAGPDRTFNTDDDITLPARR